VGSVDLLDLAGGEGGVVFIYWFRRRGGRKEVRAVNRGLAAVGGAEDVKGELLFCLVKICLEEEPVAGVVLEAEVGGGGIDGGVQAGEKATLLIEADAIGMGDVLNDGEAGV